MPGVRRVPPLLRGVEQDLVLFQSWGGQCSDNPRAIAEELRRRNAPLRQTWVLEDGGAGADATRAVRPGSRQYLEALGRAGYIVSNGTLPGYFRKKPATTYLQTWHGTPLKRIGFDIVRPSFRRANRYLRDLAREVASWDALVSPNRFSTDVLRRALRYDGRILETGYPRNDLLSSPRRDRVRADVRRRLGLEDGVRAILYAPTWRDDEAFSLQLDLDAIADRLGDGHAILLRAHALVADTVTPPGHPRVRNVSRLPDIRELYLAADVLVTDYSSAMFDFAITRKPMLFFVYDFETYRDRLRGFYFDFEAEAPGPLIRDTADLTAALEDLASVTARCEAAYRRFRERFCHLEDGRAAARVVDAMFPQAEAAP